MFGLKFSSLTIMKQNLLGYIFTSLWFYIQLHELFFFIMHPGYARILFLCWLDIVHA